jgi:DNA-binding protein H-NS
MFQNITLECDCEFTPSVNSSRCMPHERFPFAKSISIPKCSVERVIVKHPNLEEMSIDQLWALHAKIEALLKVRITAEKMELERRLTRLNPKAETDRTVRRPYPRVFPKYRNPVDLTETWSGRGKRPKWVDAQLNSGKTLDDLAIVHSKRGPKSYL